MTWIGISGSWRKTNKQVEQDVRRTVGEIISRGDGIVTGGAPGVDYFATDEVFKLNPTCEQIKIILPIPLEIYIRHYRKRAKQGIIAQQKAEELISQLVKIKQVSPEALIEMNNKRLDKDTYYARNTEVVKTADKLIAFHVNNSDGTQDTIVKAERKGIPVKIFSYNIS